MYCLGDDINWGPDYYYINNTFYEETGIYTKITLNGLGIVLQMLRCYYCF